MAFDMPERPAQKDLQRFEDIGDYARTGRLPWRRRASGAVEEIRAVQSMGAPADTRFPLRASIEIPKKAFTAALQKRFGPEIADAACHRLARTTPGASAIRLLSNRQKAGLTVLALGATVALALAPLAVAIAFNAVATLYFIAVIAFRLYLACLGFPAKPPPPAPRLQDSALPIVTILLPVYDEAEGLALLADAMRAIDYPTAKLDFKLLMEADDETTIAEAERLRLHEKFDFVLVPPGAPRTKPKACNHGLYLALGELIVIYDAEDAPEPGQLRKAAAVFAEGAPALACVQARLNFYNADENWLTRLFAIEYALWFDTLLPALEKMGAPIPLGGTSNIFRTEILRQIGGWDPYNVTEDADLGLRLARRGYRTAILDSTTFEEANCRTGNWLRQRSRWMKGYMQTWLVHMRAPREFLRAAGARGFVATQLFVAGNFFSALINPVLWIIFTFWLLTQSHTIAAFFPEPLLTLNLFALLFGNAFFIYLGVIAPLKRGWPELAPHALLAPAYWWLTSLAAYKALWQLLTRPHFWEKTEHVISEAAIEKRRAAKRMVLQS